MHHTLVINTVRQRYVTSNEDASSLCIFPAVDWHGNGAVDPQPKYVKHHGTHVWGSKSVTTWNITIGIIKFILLPVAFFMVIAQYIKVDIKVDTRSMRKNLASLWSRN